MISRTRPAALLVVRPIKNCLSIHEGMQLGALADAFQGFDDRYIAQALIKSKRVAVVLVVMPPLGQILNLNGSVPKNYQTKAGNNPD
jgi:hypothetical protein